MSNTSPIFVVGTPRSGTTLTAKILGRHTRIFMPGETHFFDDIYSRKKLGSPNDPDAMIRIIHRLSDLYGRYNEPQDQERIRRLFKDPQVMEQLKSRCSTYKEVLSTFMELQMLHEKKQRWGNNVPKDLFNISDILSFYPDVKVLICIRDIRDFLVSYQSKWKITSDEHRQRLKKLYHPVVTSLLWKANMKRIPAILDQIPEKNRMIVRYEALVTDPEKIVRAICRCVEEKFEPNMLLVESNNSSTAQQTKGVFSSSLGRWRDNLSGNDALIAQLIAGREMTQFDYIKEQFPVNQLRVIGSFLSAPVALLRAIRANSRMRGDVLPYLARRTASILFPGK